MPLYEYECRDCGRRIEEIQKVSDPPLTTCAACGGDLKRLLSPPAVQFKGSGWYVTDYAGKGTTAKGGDGDAGGKGSEAPSSSEAKGSGGGEKADSAGSSSGGAE